MQKRRKRNEKQEKRKSIVSQRLPKLHCRSFSSTPVKFVNFSAEVRKLLCRSWLTSLQKFVNFTAEVLARRQSSFYVFLLPYFLATCETRKILQRICPNPAVDLMKSSCGFYQILTSILGTRPSRLRDVSLSS